jgi:hypothetical protein
MFTRFHMLDDRSELVPVTRRAPLVMPWHGRAWLLMPSTRRLFVYLGIIAALVIIAPIIDYARNGSIRDARVTLIIAVVPATFFAFLLFFMLHSQDRPYRARQIARLARCPACDYDLAGLEAADDGCTACPECGSAWNLDLAHTSEFASRPMAQSIVDDRGDKHVMPRWVPKSSGDLWREPSAWWSDVPMRRYMVVHASMLAVIVVLWFGLLPLVQWPTWPLLFVAAAMLLGTHAWGDKFVDGRIEELYYPTGHCRNCLEPLDDLPPEDDGCVTCPACSSAWRPSTLHRTG